jgi:hypothetical protein
MRRPDQRRKTPDLSADRLDGGPQMSPAAALTLMKKIK